MRRSRKVFEVVAEVNGFQIERERWGSCVYWNAYRLDGDGYQIAGRTNLGSKAGAIAWAREQSA